MPEAPPQAHALVPTEYHFPAHPAHGEVEQRAVARLAGEPGAAADDAAGRDGGVVRAPAEGAEVGRWADRRDC